MKSSKTSCLVGHRRQSRRLSEDKTDCSSSIDEHVALCHVTDAVLKKVVATDDHLSYLPPDFTLEELQAEIALARGLATTIYVKRERLSTLKVVLYQPHPTIANLKRSIERTANLLQLRKTISDQEKSALTKSSSDTPPQQSGELVAAATSCSGRQHRSNPSWRFLWRAYALSKAIDIEQAAPIPLPDADGRQLLSDFGIGHKSVLRFVKRENYFGRQRQRS